MLNPLIVGACGNTGAKLTRYLSCRPPMNIIALAVAAQSVDAGKLISDLQRQLRNITDLPVKPLTLSLF